MARYRQLKRIEGGGFCEVWICERVGDRARFAMKLPPEDAPRDTIHRFRREVRLLSSLKHPNVVKVIGKRVKKEPYWYVMPLYKHSLQKILGTLVGDEDRITKIFLITQKYQPTLGGGTGAERCVRRHRRGGARDQPVGSGG